VTLAVQPPLTASTTLSLRENSSRHCSVYLGSRSPAACIRGARRAAVLLPIFPDRLTTADPSIPFHTMLSLVPPERPGSEWLRRRTGSRAGDDTEVCWLQHADVYAFGVLLVEMFLGERAFKGMRHPQIIHTIAVLRKHPTLPETAPKYLQVFPCG